MLLAEMTAEALEPANIRWLSGSTADTVVTQFRSSGARVVAVDGFMGSGKSPLGLMLEFRLAVPCLHVDDYLPVPRIAHQQRRYVDVLDLGRLHADLEREAAAGVALIEGVMVRNVLQLAAPESRTFHAYVAAAWKPDPDRVRWNEGDRLKLGAVNDGLDAQIVEYHGRCAPERYYNSAVLRDQNRHGVDGVLFSADGQEFTVPRELINQVQACRRRRTSGHYLCEQPGASPEPIGLLRPPRLGPGRRGLDRERLQRLLEGIAGDAPLPAVHVIRERQSGLLRLLDGAHRYFASVAVGFTRIPCEHVSPEDAEVRFRYVE